MVEHEYKVRMINWHHVGRQRVCLHKKYRDCAKRWDVVRITNCDDESKFISAVVIGLRGSKEKNIRLDFDDRDALGVSPGSLVRLKVRKLPFFSKVRWYLSARDPAIQLPAAIAMISLCLGLLGAILGLTSLLV